MKICLLANDYIEQFGASQSYGGVEVCVETLAHGLHGAGEDFFVITPKRSEKKEYPFEIIEVDFLPTSQTGELSYNFAHKAREIIKAKKPDVIWSQSHWSAAALNDLGIPILNTFHDSCSKKFGWLRKYPNVKYRFLSKFSYDNWVTEDWERGISFQCHSGLIGEDYQFSPNHEGYLLWVGGLRWGLEAKGLDITLNFGRQFKNTKVLIYGAGNPKLESYLRDESQKHENIEYMGELRRGPEHVKAFSRALGFLMPSRIPDTFPRVILESISKGTPAISTTEGSLVETVIAGVSGLPIKTVNFEHLSASCDEQAFVDSIRNLDRQKVFDFSKRFSIEKEIDKLKEESVFC